MGTGLMQFEYKNELPVWNSLLRWFGHIKRMDEVWLQNKCIMEDEQEDNSIDKRQKWEVEKQFMNVMEVMFT